MEQQIAPTLWLPPGMCLLNPMPAMHLQPTATISPHHMTSQVLKQQQFITVPTANLLQSPQLLQQAHVMPSPAQSFVHIPGLGYDNLLMPPNGKTAFELSAPLIELPCAPLGLQTQNTAVISSESTFQRHVISSKIMKKKRISPSAKRRSRLRLIAFLESKKKQSEMNSSDDNTSLQAVDDVVTSAMSDKSATSPSSCEDVVSSPDSRA